MRGEPETVPPPVSQMLARARFEVVPIKGVNEQTAYLMTGTTVAVTCSPRRGIEPTLDTCESLAGRGFRAVPHLCARQVSGQSHLQEILGRLRSAGVEELFVVGGDAREPVGPYRSAFDLLSAMAGMRGGFTRIGIAGYPEEHPIVRQENLLESLRLKQPHADYIVSQICFDPGVIFHWIEALRRWGIRLPVYIGIPGPLKRRKLLEISLRVGVGDSVRFIARQGNLVTRLAQRGGHRLDAFVARVAAMLGTVEDVAGFHLNTFNQVEAAERWRQRALATYRRPEAFE